MTNDEIESKLQSLVKEERRITHEILNLIQLSQERKVYAKRGYSSLFDWLTKRFGYSESAAYRRIEAARVLKSVPEAAAQFRSGELTLTTLAKVQSTFRAQERLTGTIIPKDEKASVLERVQTKSKTESDKILVTLFPEAAAGKKIESVRAIDPKNSRLTICLPDEVIEDLERARNLLAHTLPNGGYGDVIARVVREFLNRKDPMRKRNSSQKQDPMEVRH